MERITATAVRKAAKKLKAQDPENAALRHWQNVAGHRVHQINRADANPRTIGNPNLLTDQLEAAKRGVIEAAATL